MRTLTIGLTLFLLACGGSKDGDDSSAPTGAAAGTTSTGTTGGTAGGTTTTATATLNGRILDCAGADLGGISIKFCDPVNCRFHDTVAGDGSFTFTETRQGWTSLEAIGSSGLATAYVPLKFGDGEVRDVDLTLCPHEPSSPLGGTPAEAELGTGLWVELSSSVLEPPLFVDPATEASGLWVDPAHWVPTDDITGTVAAQWFVEPFNHKAVKGNELPVRIDGAAIGLVGTTYQMYVGSYDDFMWLDVGTFSDGDADGFYTSDSGAGLPLLGTVLLVEI